MKKILYTLLASTLILTGCYDEELEQMAEGRIFSSFTASIADIGITRSHLEGGKQVVWDEGDWIGVYSDTEDVKEYRYQESVFSGGSISGNTFYAFYPYRDNAIDPDNRNIIHVNLWGGIGYTVDSYNRPLPMVAKSSVNNLKFKQTCGLIRFSLKGTNLVNHVRLEVNNREIITGKGIIDISQDNPILQMVPDEEDTWRSSIDMWPENIQLKADENTDFYFIVPVGVYEKGITLRIYGTNPTTKEEFSIEKSTDKEVDVRRAMIKTFTGLDTDAILKEEADEIMRERQALMDLYNSTDGANWKNNKNWGSDKPLSEWYGVGTNRGHVRYLSLNDNGLKGSIPESIDLLTNLKDLQLGNNQLSGSIPESIGNLVNLEYLYLYSNQFSGSISESIGKLANLRSLDLSSNQWSGSIPESIGNIVNLESFSFYKNQLSGSIPESLGNLAQLRFIELGNNQFSGSIPESLGNLANLEDLSLSNNQLSGSIPESLGNLVNLEYLSLYNNQLSGSIPETIGNLVNLEYLLLYRNQLSGSIPESIGNLARLRDVELGDNQLSGSIPESIGNLVELMYLNIYKNQLSGSIPESIGNLDNMISLQITSNQITGSIPNRIGNLKSLESLYLDNNQLTGSIPESVGNLLNLETFCLGNNQLTGNIPNSIGNLINLTGLDFANNQLSGSIPESIGNLVKLNYMYLNNNQLTGTIPDSFINLADLSSLGIYKNQMDGILSENLLKSDWWKRMNDNNIYLVQQSGYRLKYGWLYESTDFSADGQVKKWLSHTKGNGITIVITGDAFSDRLIANGTFDEAVSWAIEAFFGIEPYTTFKDYFDVYSVTAVSKNEIIDEDIIFETKNGEQDDMPGGGMYLTNRTKIAEYVRKVPELQGDLKDVSAIILLNNEGANSRANCSWNTDGYSSGLTEVGSDGTLRHEVGGHGFAKLADEYTADDPTGNSIYSGSLESSHTLGWYMNVDTEKDPTKVLWKDFIQNHDYDVERIGIYEGALGRYSKGVYRATETSIMRGSSSSAIFNAPSRWAIYKHIMELAGESYTFQDFLAYDKKNLERIANNANTRSYVEKSAANVDVSQLGAPPIIYDYPSSEIGMH